MKIFLDDERVPVKKGWVIVRSFQEFQRAVMAGRAQITELTFDHDLGWDGVHVHPTGMDCVHWLIDAVIDEPDILSSLEKVWFHTANLGGAHNMRGLFEGAIRHKIIKPVELVDHSCLFHSDHAVMPDQKGE